MFQDSCIQINLVRIRDVALSLAVVNVGTSDSRMWSHQQLCTFSMLDICMTADMHQGASLISSRITMHHPFAKS